MDVLENLLFKLNELTKQKKLEIDQSTSKDGIYYYTLGLYEAYEYVKSEIGKEIDKSKD
jgi:hypothetical protein